MMSSSLTIIVAVDFGQILQGTWKHSRFDSAESVLGLKWYHLPSKRQRKTLEVDSLKFVGQFS